MYVQNHYLQGSDQQQEINELGIELSKRISCSITYKHYEFYGKPIFACKCGLLFPKFTIQGAIKIGDWSTILNRHNPPEPKPIPVTEDQMFWRGQVAMRKAAGDLD